MHRLLATAYDSLLSVFVDLSVLYYVTMKQYKYNTVGMMELFSFRVTLACYHRYGCQLIAYSGLSVN